MDDEARQWADLAPADLLTFRCYAPSRGAALTFDRDGELNLRLSAPGADRDAVMAFYDALGVGGEGRVLRVVVVDDDKAVAS